MKQGYKQLDEVNIKALQNLNKMKDKLIQDSIKSLEFIEHNMFEDIDSFKEKVCIKLCEEIEKVYKLDEDNGYGVALIGITGAGKSELINAIFKSKVAEVAESLSDDNTTEVAKYYEYKNGIKFIDTAGFSAKKGGIDSFFLNMLNQLNNPEFNKSTKEATIDIGLIAFRFGVAIGDESIAAITLMENNIPVIFVATEMDVACKKEQKIHDFVANKRATRISTLRSTLDEIDVKYGIKKGSSSSKVDKIHFVSSLENFGIDELRDEILGKIQLIEISRHLTTLDKYKKGISEMVESCLKNMDKKVSKCRQDALNKIKSKNGILDKPLDQKDTANIKKMFSDIWKAYGFKKEIERAENPDVITTFGQIGLGVALTISFGISYRFFRSEKDTLLASECDKLADECIKDARKSAEEIISVALNEVLDSKIKTMKDRLEELNRTQGTRTFERQDTKLNNIGFERR